MVLAIAAVMLLASCSHSGKKAAGAAPNSATTTTSKGTNAPAKSNGSKSSSPTTATSAASNPASVSTVKPPANSPSAFCSALYSGTYEVANPELPAKPSEWQTSYVNEQQTFDGLGAQAPPELKGDLQTIAGAYDLLAHEVAATNGNVGQAMVKIIANYRAPNFKAAVAHLTQYLTNVCKTPLPKPLTAPASAPTTPPST